MNRSELLLTCVLLSVSVGCARTSQSTRPSQAPQLATFEVGENHRLIAKVDGRVIESAAKFGEHEALSCCDLCNDLCAHLSRVNDLKGSDDLDDVAQYWAEALAAMEVANMLLDNCGGQSCASHCEAEGKTFVSVGCP